MYVRMTGTQSTQKKQEKSTKQTNQANIDANKAENPRISKTKVEKIIKLSKIRVNAEKNSNISRINAKKCPRQK